MSSSTVSSTFQPYSGKTISFSSYQRFQHQSEINDQLDKSPVKLENHQDNFFNKPKSLTKSEENGHYLNEPYEDEVTASNYVGRSNEDEFYEDNAINSSKKVDSQDYEKDYDIGSDHMIQSASSALKEGYTFYAS